MQRLTSRSSFSLRIRLVVALVMAASPSLVAITASPASANVGALQLVAPVTDNYKTWVDDRTRNGPGHTDNRTSLLFTGIAVDGQTYVVPQSVRDAHGSPVGAPTEWYGQGGIPLATSVAGPVVARLAFDHTGANAYSYFRLWPDGVFGPLMTINRSAFVAAPHTPVTGTFGLRNTAGTLLATGAMSYRYDAAIAALPESSAEWRGPLGRWHAGSDTTAPTPLNWPAAIAVSGAPGGPHLSQISIPAGQASTLYVAPVDTAGLGVPRVPEAISLAWSPGGAGRPTSASGAQAWRPISVTAPQGTYGLQATGTCPQACRFDYQPQALTPASSQVVASSAPTYRPDAEIRAANGAWTGGGVFPPTTQSMSSSIPLGSSRNFEVRITNTGTVTDTYGLADARSGSHTAFEYTWRYNGVDVTTQVHVDGWFVLRDVPVGATRTLELTVTAKAGLPVGAASQYALHAYHSPASAGIKDVVGLALVTTAGSTDAGYVRPPGAPEVPIQACSRYAAPTGNDANPGTAASPVLTLNRLTSALQPGQTGCLKDESEIVLPATGGSGVMVGGTAGQPKIIRPETPGKRATVRGLGKFLVAATQSDLIIKDIDIRGADDAGGGNLFHVNGDRVMLDGVDISWPRNICLGVGAANGQFAEDFVLIDSRIHDCGATHVNNPNDPGGAHGAYLQYVRDGADADSWGAVVYNTLFDHNDARGLQLYPDADRLLVDRVVMYGNGSNLNIGADSTTVRSEGSRIRNTILANSRLDFDDPLNPNPTSTNDVVGYFPNGGHDGADNQIVASCLSNTVRPGYLFAVTSNGNSLTLSDVTQNQPPTFVDVAARNFRLAAGSTCLGMGLSDASRLPYGTASPPPTAATDGLFRPVTPSRVVDTRSGVGSVNAPIPAYGTRSFTLAGKGGVPENGVGAVVANVTVTQPSTSGYLTVWPQGRAEPASSNLNFAAGQSVPNLVQIAIGANGGITVRNGSGGTAHVLVDVAGWFTDATAVDDGGGRFRPLAPYRILDTRNGGPAVNGGSPRTLQVTGTSGGDAGNAVPVGSVSAVALNVTVTQPSTDSFLTVYPSDAASPPPVSNLNFTAGQTVPNRVVVPVSADGKISLANFAGQAHVIVDVNGYYMKTGTFAPGSRFKPLLEPQRVADSRPGGPPPDTPWGPGTTRTIAITEPAGIPAFSNASAAVLNVTVTNPDAPASFLTVLPAGNARPNASDLNFVAGQTVPNLVIAKLGTGGAVDIYNHAGNPNVIVDVLGYYVE